MIATAVVAAATIALLVLVPGLHPAYRDPELHVALVTAESLIGLLLALLAAGRLHRRRRLDDLALCAAFAVLAVTNLFLATVPAVFGGEGSVFASRSALLGRIVGAALLTLAAFAPSRRVRLSPIRFAPAGVLVVTAPAAMALAVVLVAPEHASAVLVAQAAGFLTFVAAAVGFTVRGRRSPDALSRWLAVGAVLGAAAHADSALRPSLFTDDIAAGDAFRVLFSVVVAVAASSEMRSHWRAAAAASALAERQRIARELHDGLAQELACIRRNLHCLDPENRFVARATAGAERAEAESRNAIAALVDDHARPLDASLADAARAIEEREGAHVVLHVDGAVSLPPTHREALVRIASEAMINAVRHGRADVVRVELTGGRHPRLRVEDAGAGFQLGLGPEPPGHGLRTMRARAEAMGAEFRLESGAGAGTRVEVIL